VKSVFAMPDCIAFTVEYGYPDYRTKFAEEIQMIAFYLSLAALGAAGVALIRELAAAQAKQRAALRPVRVQSANRGTGRSTRRG
jgi:hypothetical protein